MTHQNIITHLYMLKECFVSSLQNLETEEQDDNVEEEVSHCNKTSRSGNVQSDSESQTKTNDLKLEIMPIKTSESVTSKSVTSNTQGEKVGEYVKTDKKLTSETREVQNHIEFINIQCKNPSVKPKCKKKDRKLKPKKKRKRRRKRISKRLWRVLWMYALQVAAIRQIHGNMNMVSRTYSFSL